jgi:preprotein translocase subunit SecF
MEFFKPGRVFDFMGQRLFWIPLSFILVIGSIILTF